MGLRQAPLLLKLGPITAISIGLGLLARGGRGTQYRKSKLPEKPLDIWGALEERMAILGQAILPCCTAWSLYFKECCCSFQQEAELCAAR